MEGRLQVTRERWVELLHLFSASIQMKTKGLCVEEAGKNALLGDEILRKELYATSAVVRH